MLDAVDALNGRNESFKELKLTEAERNTKSNHARKSDWQPIQDPRITRAVHKSARRIFRSFIAWLERTYLGPIKVPTKGPNGCYGMPCSAFGPK